MGKPAIRDIELVAGDAYDHEITVVRDGSPVDISDWEITATVRHKAKSPDGEAFSVDMSEPDQGKCIVSLTADQTYDLHTESVWDVQRIVDDKPITFMRGSVTVTWQVTRP